MTTQSATASVGSSIAKPTRPLTKIADDLEKASAALEVANHRAKEAQRLETDCRNRVNSLQGEMDAALEKLRDKAVPDTNWYRQKKGVREHFEGTSTEA